MARDTSSFNNKSPLAAGSKQRKRVWRIRISLLLLLLVATAVTTMRVLLPDIVHGYVNRTLDRNPLYSGRVGDVDLHIWRGAYALHDVRISKVTGSAPVPLFSAERVDLAIQWDALFHRQLVGQILLVRPTLNFVDGPDDSSDQTGGGGPWLGMIADLFPFHLNRATIDDGSIHFRSYVSEQPVEVRLSDVDASIDNLTNIRKETEPLISKIHATARVMDQAKLEFNMVLDPFSYRPTFHLTTRLLGLDVTRLNELALAYGGIDFEHGWFDLVIEAEATHGQLEGYVKPLFRELQVFSLKEDVGDGNPLTALWQGLTGLVTAVFENKQRDQFGTLIPFQGDLSGATTVDILETIGNVLHNAFIRAYLPNIENLDDADWTGSRLLHFEAPAFEEHVAVGNSS